MLARLFVFICLVLATLHLLKKNVNWYNWTEVEGVLLCPLKTRWCNVVYLQLPAVAAVPTNVWDRYCCTMSEEWIYGWAAGKVLKTVF